MTADAGRTHIAEMSLKTLRNRYHKDLFDHYLPFMDRYGIDHELGGFICALDHDGTRANTDKYMWYQGRGLWVYSYLYNHFGGEYYLEIARKTRDFIVRYGQDDQGGWYTSLDREGRPNSPVDNRGYAGLFVAEGLQAFAAASGDQESLDFSTQILWDMLAALDDPQFYVDEGYVPVSYPGMRTLGSHMVLILILTQILTQRADPALEQLAERVRDGIMNRFWNPEYRLLNEALTTDYQRPDDDNEDFVYLGHAIETMWMMMHEAIRLNDRDLFDVVAERFHRHVEVAWDDVYGGVFRAMNVHGSYLFDKVLWAQEEVLIGTMILMEHTDLEWPAYWFDKMYRHIQETFSLQSRGLPHYQESGDRKMTFKPHVSRKENYHHPRHLMLNVLSLERMMKQ
ncbi:MAG: AGE family epimerase/isomerase [Candidatus Latescibacteria bacterium]|nr:AGE family epimerase/isomerase [Candidatus Latescibacterota bacterium]